MERLSKNFIWTAAANIAGSFFGVVVFVYLARTLLPEAFGYFSYSLTLVFYLANFIDLGLSTYGIREISKDRPRAPEYASEIISLRFLVAAGLSILFIAASSFLAHPNILKILMIETSLMFFIVAFSPEWPFQGLEKMHMVFVSFATTAVVQVILIFTLVKGPADLLRVPVIYFISSVPVIAIFLRRLHFKLHIRRLDFRKIKFFLSSSLVIWSISIFAQVYNGLDIVILGFFREPAEVGYFAIGRRIISAVTFFFIFLANAVLPRLSCTFRDDMAQFNQGVRKFLRLAIIVTILGFVPAILFSKALISLVVGSAYLPARVPLNIMLAGLAFVLLNLPFSTGLIAACFEKDVLRQTIVCAAFNIVSNLILMPRYGMNGAAASFLTTEVMALIWILLVYRRRLVRITV